MSKSSAKGQGLTYREVEKIAIKHYDEGGDVLYNCWGQEEVDDWTERYGRPMTEKDVLKLCRMYKDMEEDRKGWR